MNIGIDHISYAFPDGRAETNDELAATHGFDRDFISQKLGIDTRLKLKKEETVSDLCTGAVNRLVEETNLDIEKVEAFGVITQTPDYCLPHTSAIVHSQVGLPKNCAAFDIGLGCSGYVYGLAIMRGLMIAEGLSCGILATADAYSKIMNPKDKATAPLFGDAASASLLGTDGDKHQALIVRGSGSRPEKSEPLFMDGRAIFNFMMTEVPKSVMNCLEVNKLSINDIDFFVFHQASEYMLKTLASRMKIPLSKLVVNMRDIGNTTSSSIPVALQRCVLANKHKNEKQSKILLSGFGVGLSWATSVLFVGD
jgi:3-oxoacyl-[acyl-carrier-protein] synthase-3